MLNGSEELIWICLLYGQCRSATMQAHLAVSVPNPLLTLFYRLSDNIAQYLVTQLTLEAFIHYINLFSNKYIHVLLVYLQEICFCSMSYEIPLLLLIVQSCKRWSLYWENSHIVRSFLLCRRALQIAHLQINRRHPCIPFISSLDLRKIL
jgi:hypothetical protein